ncbi:MAG: hypothetical protein LC099_04680 [Anaerolineales bacterium]|nr:hypothetical protein [Anaerolineales bacterium]
MLFDILSWAAVGLAFLAASTLLVSRDWRISLGALALQYFAAFWLITRHLPFAMGSVKLISGWMVVAILGMTRYNLGELDDDSRDSFFLRGAAFRFVLTAVAALVALGATPRIEAAIPGLGLPVIAGGLILVGAGVAHLGLTDDPLRVALGLLTLISGFEILYAAVESAILVAGLLALINLGLGLSGAYLLLAGSVPFAEEGEEFA